MPQQNSLTPFWVSADGGDTKAMAEKKFAIAQRELAAAQARMDKMASYLKDSSVAVEQTRLEVERIEKGLV